MQLSIDRPEAPTAIRTDIGAIFVSMELSRSTWLITSLSPGSGEKMSKHGLLAGDVGALLARFAELQAQGIGADRRIVSNRRHSGSGSGRLLDSSGAAAGRD